MDIGNHILATAFGVPADDYASILSALRDHEILSEELHSRLVGFGGFRKILVHGYLRLDRERVEEHLRTAPADFSAFSDAVEAWLQRREQGAEGGPTPAH